MAKFDNAKVGDRVWSIRYGWGKIKNVALNKVYGLLIEFLRSDGTPYECVYTFDGKDYDSDRYPTLFWNGFHIPTEKEDKKPFNLVEFLRENLEPVEFNEDKFNYFLTYNVRSKELEFNASMICVDVHLTYFHLCSDELKNVERTLNDNKVTIQQLKDAYRMLGWL